jgi:hypothetical protein
LDGLRLETQHWRVEPLAIDEAYSSFFSDEARFPPGSVEFDCALIMRDIPHQWRAEPMLTTDCAAGEVVTVAGR